MKKIISTCLFLTCSFFAFGQKRPALEKPNIIVILTDDQGYADVGFNGSKDIPTPGIDRIATNGVVFEAGYVSYAVCGPSRAGLITGRYQDRFGFSRNPLLAPKDPTMGLPLSEETMGDVLKKSGYKTGVLGKWHLGMHPTLRPNQRGFDEFYGFLEGGHRYFPEDWNLRDESEAKTQYDGYRTKLVRNDTPVEETEYLTDALSREALNFVKAHQDEPFFLYLAYNAPHAPMQATEKYLNRFPNIQDPKRRTYAAMVSAVDDGVGALLDLLAELEIEENTVVFFLSDNGGPTKDNASDNRPLRGFKSDFFEGGVRVPFAMQWKGQVPTGQRFEHPVISLDIFATAASLAKAKPKNELDGVNLIPFLTGEKQEPPHQALYWRNFDRNRFAIRTPDSKMILESQADYLFDIQSDLSESNNLIGTDITRKNKLSERIEQWKKLLMDPLFLGLLEEKEYNLKHPDRFTPEQKDKE
ncbi:N-acetylgalactosamine 6-sulfate sulfatase [Algoriphagus lacus]|uniref:N-acetylgalactosamine 6-sulfate sulfatase n=1 Tax=Algoriphagus lacus TaxID=2056311 RepID=A0A418PTT6_9BACT|nr:sulfatase-like hydrolase/transferase [Algoriphagus lacus]RIW16489.1 N-acetylgalactosamine 6-sulfate sulfatase [Algoriphagus lacus]